MRKRSQATAFGAVVLAALALLGPEPIGAQGVPAFGAELQGFDYADPVDIFSFPSQRQTLQMAYSDVAPRGTPNGRTAVLLHGKNFCAGT